MTIRKEHRTRNRGVNWQLEIESLLNDLRAGVIDRRRFLSGIAAFLGMVALPSAHAVTSIQTGNTRAAAGGISKFTEDPWLTIAVVQDHLFPSAGDGPGASEINATRYLQGVLDEPEMDQDDSKFILDGVDWLNDMANRNGNTVFAGLDEEQRESVLRQIEKTRAGERWISLILR